MAKKRRVTLKLICEICGDDKVIAHADIDTQTIKEINVPGAMLGGFLNGWEGAFLGGLLLGNTHHVQNLSVLFECQECIHESASCNFQNGEGEELTAYEVRELLEEALEGDIDVRLANRISSGNS